MRGFGGVGEGHDRLAGAPGVLQMVGQGAGVERHADRALGEQRVGNGRVGSLTGREELRVVGQVGEEVVTEAVGDGLPLAAHERARLRKAEQLPVELVGTEAADRRDQGQPGLVADRGEQLGQPEVDAWCGEASQEQVAQRGRHDVRRPILRSGGHRARAQQLLEEERHAVAAVDDLVEVGLREGPALGEAAGQLAQLGVVEAIEGEDLARSTTGRGSPPERWRRAAGPGCGERTTRPMSSSVVASAHWTSSMRIIVAARCAEAASHSTSAFSVSSRSRAPSISGAGHHDSGGRSRRSAR